MANLKEPKKKKRKLPFELIPVSTVSFPINVLVQVMYDFRRPTLFVFLLAAYVGGSKIIPSQNSLVLPYQFYMDGSMIRPYSFLEYLALSKKLSEQFEPL